MRVNRREVLGLLGLGACGALAACAGPEDPDGDGASPGEGRRGEDGGPSLRDGGADGAHDPDGSAVAQSDASAPGDGAGGEGAADGSAPNPSDAGGEQSPGECAPTRPDAQGPFYAAGAPHRMVLAGPDEPGERIRLSGVVVADDCVTPISGALLDVWQADKDGAYYDATESAYRLRGQVLSDVKGRFQIETIRPGHYENGPGNWRPAHIHFTVSAPGRVPVTTQLYFAGDPYLSPNDGCPSCGSDDMERIVELSTSGTFLVGTWRVVLART